MCIRDRFQTTTLRTAGFNSIDLSLTKEPTILLMVILMLIGASPASTGGGIKTTTVAVLFLTVKDFLCGKDEIHIFERSISSESIKKAVSYTNLDVYKRQPLHSFVYMA